MKTCTRCQLPKDDAPDKDFRADTRKPGRTRSICKTCERELDTAYRLNNPDKRNEARQKYEAANAEKLAQKAAAWRAAHPDYARTWRHNKNEKAKAATDKYRGKNPEKVQASTHDWYSRNAESEKRKTAEWQRANADAMAAINANARAARYLSNGLVTAEMIQQLFTRQTGHCANPHCHVILEITVGTRKRFHLDHIRSLRVGGSNEFDNLQLLCPNCNRRKSDADWQQFLALEDDRVSGRRDERKRAARKALVEEKHAARVAISEHDREIYRVFKERMRTLRHERKQRIKAAHDQ